jgi:hypothetical protein
MSNPVPPTNNLDRAIAAFQKSDAATPELYRELAQGEIWFLVPYHPEVENSVLQLKNGSPLPFARIKDGDGQVVPLFSSSQRLDEGLRKAKVPPRTFSAASMPARQALEILGHVGLRAIVNKACATGSITIPPELMRDLANGKALKPLAMATGETRQVVLTILDPSEYPTNLIQPIFELLRKHKNFRAAWVFGAPVVEGFPRDPNIYYVLVLMDPRDQVLFHDFNMVTQAATKGVLRVEISLADEKDAAYVASLFKQTKPFYVAADYRPPA